MNSERKVSFTIVVFVLIGLVAVTLVTLATLVGAHATDNVTNEFALSWVVRIVGAYIAAAAAVTMLVQVLRMAQPQTIIPSVFPFLAGLMLYQTHWSGVLGLAIVAVSYIVAHTIASAKAPSDQ
jgi:hypothetical protein